jgi:uncharacterized protein YfaS (alpha-2-macroglobulin family)
MKQAIICVLIVLTSITAYAQKKQIIMQENFKAGDPYTRDWEQVQAKENDGLPKSAKELALEIFKKAKHEQNHAQQIKAAIYQTKFNAEIEEEGLVKAIADFEKEAAASVYPVKPVLQSILGDFYWQYYQNNRYWFLNRTETKGVDDKDIQTWNLNKILEKTTATHQAALRESARLKGTSLGFYDEILETGTDSKLYRPTLFDFIAHRALDFYKNEERALTKPIYEFEITSLDALQPAEAFVNVTFNTEDSTSLKYQAMLLYQDLVRFHLNDSLPEAYIEVDLERLAYAYQQTFNEGKDEAYLTSLRKLETAYASNPVSAQVSYTIAQYFFNKGAEKDKEGLNGNQRALQICELVMSRYPSSRGGLNCKALKQQIFHKTMSVVTERSVVPEKPFRALITYTNLNHVYGRIVKIPENDDKWKYEYIQNNHVRAALRLTALRTFDVSLPLPSDYMQHSAEFKVDGLPKGNYILITSANSTFSLDGNGINVVEFWVSDLSFIATNNTDDDNAGSKTFCVMNAQSGKAIQGATAQLYEENYDYQTRTYKLIRGNKYTTDRDGKFTVPASRDAYRSFQFELTYLDDQLRTNDYYYASRQSKPQHQETNRAVLFTDRSIYRPGQTVYFKGILLKSSWDNTKHDVMPNTTAQVEFYDVNYQKVSSLSLTSNDYGTISGSFTAPVGVLNGQMQIQVYFLNGNGTVYFSVEEYKRPKFITAFKPVKESYRLEEKVSVTGFAKSYAGGNITDAMVKYHVVRDVSYPYWRWSYWWMPMPSTRSREIAHGTIKTNDRGEFTIEFPALADKSVPEKNSPQFSYTITADVTDLNGETRSATTSVNVGYVAMNVSMSLPQTIDKTKPSKLVIDTRNLNGEFEAAKGTVKLFRVETPSRVFRGRLWAAPDQTTMTKENYYANFPNDLYAQEDIVTSDSLKTAPITTMPFDNVKESQSLPLKLASYASGQYIAVVETKDRFGKALKIEQAVTLYAERDAEPARRKPSYFVAPEKASYQPGDVVKFIWGSANEDVTAYYEIEHRGVVVKSERITISKAQRVFEIPVEEKHRGGFTVRIYFIKNNRYYFEKAFIDVPWSNKDLKLEFTSFRNKLLPGQTEEWKLTVKGSKAEKVAAEMVASLYDASLDVFRSHDWSLDLYPTFYSRLQPTTGNCFTVAHAQASESGWNPYAYYYYPSYDRLKDYGLRFYEHGYYVTINAMRPTKSKNGGGNVVAEEVNALAAPPPPPPPAPAAIVVGAEKKSETSLGGSHEIIVVNEDEQKPKQDFSDVKARANLNETAFFFPTLTTNENGEISFTFTIPEALTKWKFLGLAHTKDLSVGQLGGETVTQKDLMVQPNAPRFFRENDAIEFPAKITNLTEKELTGSARLMLFDAVTMKPIDALFGTAVTDKNFTVKAGQNAGVSWNLKIPEGVSAVLYRVVAKAGNQSDGEEAALPVLSDKLLVTESLPLPVRSNQTKTFEFTKLLNSSQSNTLRHERLTLEFTSNPAWYAIQALPYLMEFPYECAEQLFSRYYANSIATFIANSNPKIKRVFETWKTNQPAALTSNLQKNQELKQALLEETPWVLDGQDETARKQRVALLFELNNMQSGLARAEQKLIQMQTPNGGFPWFAGMPDNRWITQHIVAGFGHLDRLGIYQKEKSNAGLFGNMNPQLTEALRKAILYLDERMREDYEWIMKHDHNPNDNHLSYEAIHYLYARSYFKSVAVEERNQKAFDYWKAQAETYWTKNNVMCKGMVALAFYRFDESKDKALAKKIMQSVKEYSISSEELGMYWKENTGGYYWYQAPIETEALMVECFDEIMNDKESVESIKTWLLKNKQTTDWKTTKATVEACYALLLRGTDLLASDKLAEVTLGSLVIGPKTREDVNVEAGTGYYKTSWSKSEVKPEYGRVQVKNPNPTVAWGALYWQYFERMDKITSAETPLTLKKQLFIERITDKGKILEPIAEQTPIQVGDLVKVRVELRVDREMEFIHMKDWRASGFEPTNVMSSYKYQDGLGYYESTRDAATHFFMDYVGKGTYVFEYGLRATHRGTFQNGITMIQSMYAPEFSSHSEGVIVEIK